MGRGVDAEVTNVQNGTVDRVEFLVIPDAGSSEGFASVSPTSDNDYKYETKVTANVADASGDLEAKVIMGGAKKSNLSI